MSGTLQASVVKDEASATNNLTLDASGNVTVGNNLTVSGTGNTSFSGNVGIGTSSPNYKLQVKVATDKNFGVGNAINLADGITLSSVNDANGANKGLELRGTNVTLTAPGASAYMNFRTGNTETEQMRIDSSGNVGIGTSSPGTKLDAYTSGTTSTVLRTRNDTTTVYLDANNGYAYLNTFTNHPLLFGTNNTERMRIDTSGNLLVGTTSGTGKFVIKQAADNDYSKAPTVIRNGTTDNWVYMIDGSTNRLYWALNQTGKAYIDASTGAWTTVSDLRAKKDIANIHYGLKEILQLRPVEYRMIDDADDSKKHVGFIAQEVENIISEAVSPPSGPDNLYGLDKTNLIPVLVAALQEAVDKITALEDRITKLESGK